MKHKHLIIPAIVPTIGLLAIVFTLSMQAHAATDLFLVAFKTSDSMILQSDTGRVYLVDSEPCTVQVGDSVAVDTNLDGGPLLTGKITYGARYFNTVCSIWNSRPVSQRINVTKAMSNDEQFLGRYADQTTLITYGPGCGLSVKNYERQDVYLALGNNTLDAVNDTLILPNGNTCPIMEVTMIDSRSVYAATCPANSVRHPTNKKLCVCDVGFQPDADGRLCVGTPLLCPAHSTLYAGNCQCDQGYVAKNNTCITEQAACQYDHGPYADGNRSQCWCQAGYHFGRNNRCVRDDDVPPSTGTTAQPSLYWSRCPEGTYVYPGTNICVPWY